MNMNKNFSLIALTLTAVLSLSACSDDKAEEAGEKIDNAISSTKDAAKDAGDKVKEAATDAGNAIEDACEDTKEKLDAKDTDC